MARFRLSNDILSPLNSDISLNDGSVFSFGSLPGTPIFDSNIASPICSASAKDTDINPLCTKTVKECTNAFDEITNDIKKQSSINSEKEEKYKETFEMLKKSMDDLFHSNDSNSSLSSPQLMNSESTTENLKSEVHSKINTAGKFQDSKNVKIHKEITCPDPVNSSEATERKSEKNNKEISITDRLKKKQQKSKSTSSESIKDTKKIGGALIRNNVYASEKKDTVTDQKKKSKIISSENEGASFEDKVTSSKILPEKNKGKEIENVKKYHFKCQKKIPVSNDMPTIGHRSLSIEKPIQLAVSMEMDNIRRFVLHQNLYMHKDLLKLQEMAKKQNEVTEYLFSVIDELLDTNKKLISKFI